MDDTIASVVQQNKKDEIIVLIMEEAKTSPRRDMRWCKALSVAIKHIPRCVRHKATNLRRRHSKTTHTAYPTLPRSSHTSHASIFFPNCGHGIILLTRDCMAIPELLGPPRRGVQGVIFAIGHGIIFATCAYLILALSLA